MNIIDELLRAEGEITFAVLPTPSYLREGVLELAREKVRHYKPKIEAEFGISLGNVEVKDQKHWLVDSVSYSANQAILEHAERMGEIPTEAHRKFYWRNAEAARLIGGIPFFLYANYISGAFARAANGSIYMPFGYMSRMTDHGFNERMKYMGRIIMHEIGHCVWDKLKLRKIDKELFGDRVWKEGFCTYVADVRFANLYPEEFEGFEMHGVYKRGLKLVEGVVEKHGIGALRELPRRWKEFDKEFRN
jgi:hypothetical protein